MIMQRLAKLVGLVSMLVLSGSSIGSADPRPAPDVPEAQPMRPSCQVCSEDVELCVEDGVPREVCQKQFARCFANCVGGWGQLTPSEGEDTWVGSDDEPGTTAPSR
jgi:hypothetical protein